MEMMEVKEEDSKDWFIKLEDFPFICRICCKRRDDLRPFEEESYLLDVFQTIRKTDVHLRINFPRNICKGCIDKLQEISVFIEILKNNSASVVRLECPESIECEMSSEKDVSLEKSEICRICLSPLSLTLNDKWTHLIQLFQDLTNQEAKYASNMCNSCMINLEMVSSFTVSSKCSDEKFENIIAKNKTVPAESYSNSNDDDSLEFDDIKPTSSADQIDIKEEIIDVNVFTSANHQSMVELNSKNIQLQNLQCNLCQKTYTKETYLKRHMLIHGEKKYQCDRCEKRFTEKYSLRNHLPSHYIEMPHKCNFCQKSFMAKKSFQNHLKIHAMHAVEETHKCDHCKSIFYQKTDLLSHTCRKLMKSDCYKKKFRQKSLSKNKSLKCNGCDETFTRKFAFRQHLMTHVGDKSPGHKHVFGHSEDKPYKCKICGKGLATKSSLRQHFLGHTGVRSFKCDYCKRIFARKSSLEQHLLTYYHKKPHKLERCEKSFEEENTFQLDGAENKLPKCNICQKIFTLSSSLRSHLLLHTGERPFKCDFCQKSFTQKSTLHQHFLTHVVEKPYKCDVCKKGFTSNSILRRHSFIHTDEKPFRCYCCGERFIQNYLLQRHLLSHSMEKQCENVSGKSSI